MTAHGTPSDLQASDALVIIRPRVLAKPQAAKYIGCGITKMDELIAKGEVLAKRISVTKVVVFVDSLDAYLERLPNAREGKRQ
jgi:hypothetical protein